MREMRPRLRPHEGWPPPALARHRPPKIEAATAAGTRGTVYRFYSSAAAAPELLLLLLLPPSVVPSATLTHPHSHSHAEEEEGRTEEGADSQS